MKTKNSKIKEIYCNLSNQDKDGITSFLSCSLFNQSDIVIAIHLYLSENIEECKDLDKLELYQHVFKKGEKFSDGKLRVFLTKLSKLIEKYLIVKHLDSYPLAELTILNQYYSRNHLHKNYSVFFSNKSKLSFDSYEEKLLYDYIYSLRKGDYVVQEYSTDSESIRKHVEVALDNQQKLNFFQTLKSQCDFMSVTQKYRMERDSSFEDSILQGLVARRKELSVVFNGYILVYLLQKDATEENFLELKEIIMSGEILYESNYKAIVKHAQNICIKFINSGQSGYLSHLFDIYSLGLKFYSVPGDLSSANFRNILYCALQLEKIDWAESFVENYHLKVEESEQENAYNFNYARIYFERGDYKLAMRQLLKVTYEDSYYASTGRILLIKCYYELNDEMPLLSCCGSLSQFFKRNKEFTKQRVENNLHFIKYVKNLQKHRLRRDKKFFNTLYSKVSNSNTVEKEWLLKKIDDLN